MKENIERMLSEALAILFGERAMVLGARYGTDEVGNYVDCCWVTQGNLRYSEGRIYEGTVRECLPKVPRHAFSQILVKLANQHVPPVFHAELQRELMT